MTLRGDKVTRVATLICRLARALSYMGDMRVHGYGKRLCVCALVYSIYLYVRLVRDVANAKTTINHDAISCLDARHVRRVRAHLTLWSLVSTSVAGRLRNYWQTD